MAKKTKNNRPKRAGQPRRRSRQPVESISHVAHEICSFVNPFCPQAKGSKWPDGSCTRSTPLSFVGSLSLTTDTNGNLSRVFISDRSLFTIPGTVNNANKAAAAGTPVNFPSSPTMPIDSRYRITSVGYKISCIGTRMNTKGMLRVRLVSPMQATGFSGWLINTSYADQIKDLPLSRLIEKDLYVTCAASGTNARLFQDAGTNVTPATLADIPALEWQSLVVSVDGGEVDTTCLQVEAYVHYEIVYPMGSLLYNYGTPPHRASTSLIDNAINTASKVGGFIEGTAKLVDSVYNSSAVQLLLNAHPSSRGPNLAIQGTRRHIMNVD